MLKLIIQVVGLLTLRMRYCDAAEACCYDAQYDDIQMDVGDYRLYADQIKWPEGIIFYDVDPHMDPYVRHYIAKAIDYINNLGTCVRWIERRADGIDDHIKSWLSVYQITEAVWRTNKLKASATLGWKKDRYSDFVIETHYARSILFKNQEKSEGSITEEAGNKLLTIILHEMMHVLGFTHEHQRPDRDCFIYVGNRLIKLSTTVTVNPYGKLPRKYYSPDFPYDYESVLHYEQSRNLFPHDRSKKLWRKDGKLSEMDIQKIKYMYCNGETWCEFKGTCRDPYTDLTDFYRTNPLCYRQGQEYSFSTNLSCQKCIIGL